MKIMKLTFLILTINLCDFKLSSPSPFNREQLNDAGLSTDEIIRKYGYPAENHTTVSEDGYILTLFRIPHGRNSTKVGFPIVLAHALFSDSSLFVLHGEESLGFFLADEGYDVWLTNMRGTIYARNHMHLSHRSSKFWDFSWHEYGLYDLPAFTDYVCSYTENPDVLLLGFSMGTTAIFVMASERPEYSGKIRGAIMLAPVATLRHSTSPLKYISPVLSTSQVFSKIFLKGRFNYHNTISRKIFEVACNATLVQLLMCRRGIFLLDGSDYKGFDEAALMNFILQGQSSTSTKSFAHYAQLMISGKFRKYDYGFIKNLRKYKQLSPPEYHLESISTPMCFFVAAKDVFATPKDVEETLRGRPFVKSIYYIPRRTFIHSDFIVGKDAKELVYYKILPCIKYFMGQVSVSG